MLREELLPPLLSTNKKYYYTGFVDEELKVREFRWISRTEIETLH
jgi:hypothetical protein